MKWVNYLRWKLVNKTPGLRVRLQKVLYPDRDLFVDLCGEQIFINTQKELGYWRASKQQGKSAFFHDEMPTLLKFVALIHEHSTFIDCGANVGSWTKLIAALKPAHPGLRVIAFEPNPTTFGRLLKTVQGLDHVKAINVALSDKDAVFDMTEGATSGAFAISSTGPKKYVGPQHVVTAKPLDDFVQGLNHLVIKIDVEGHELEVLRGASKALTEHRIDAVYIDGMRPGTQTEIYALLRQSGLEPMSAPGLQPNPAPNAYRVFALARASRGIGH